MRERYNNCTKISPFSDIIKDGSRRTGIHIPPVPSLTYHFSIFLFLSLHFKLNLKKKFSRGASPKTRSGVPAFGGRMFRTPTHERLLPVNSRSIQDKISSDDFVLRFYVPLVTKWVISETSFTANLFASTEETKPNTTMQAFTQNARILQHN